MEPRLGKELPSVTIISDPDKPTLLTVNGRTFIAGGRWNDAAVADFVLDHGQDKWLTIGEIAKFAHVSTSVTNKKKVRAHLSALFKELRNRGMFLAIEYAGKHKAASAVKIADLKSTAEKEAVENKLKRMLKSKELSEDQYIKSKALMDKLSH